LTVEVLAQIMLASIRLCGFQHMSAVCLHAGPRICLGQNMAYLEAKFMMASVLQRFRFRLADGRCMHYSAKAPHPPPSLCPLTPCLRPFAGADTSYGVTLTLPMRFGLPVTCQHRD